MAHTAHHDDHAHEKNSHHHAPADPKKVLPGVIFVLALFWGLTYAGHYMFIQSAKGGHDAPVAHGAPAETHGAEPAKDDAGHH